MHTRLPESPRRADRTRSHVLPPILCRMRSRAVLIVLPALLLALLALPNLLRAAPETAGLVEAASHATPAGLWKGQRPSQPDWDLVFEVTETSDGEFHGSGYWFERGGINSTFALDEVRFDEADGAVRLRFATVVYSASLDATGEALTGTLDYGQEPEPLTMMRVSVEDVPGLHARPQAGDEPYVYAYAPPADLGDAWDIATLAAEGLDTATMEALVQAIVDGQFALIHSLVVVRNGRLVMDEYFYGYTPELPHALQSCTKSITSLLVGQAIDQGFIDGVDTPILAFFPDRADAAAEGWDEVTLQDVLTMTAGAEWPEDGWRDAFYGADDRFLAALSHPVVHDPGAQFAYVSPNVDLLAGVVRHATGRHCDDFAEEFLFAPLGIDAYNWDNLRWKGYPLCDGSLRLRSRDMAKVGQMMLDGGVWKGRQVVSASWVTDSFTRHATDGGQEGYGYLWWMTEKEVGGHTIVAYFASGMGSQFIFMLPQFDLVVVTTGGNLDNGRHWATAQMIEGYILPALVKGGGPGGM